MTYQEFCKQYAQSMGLHLELESTRTKNTVVLLNSRNERVLFIYDTGAQRAPHELLCDWLIDILASACLPGEA